MRLSLLFLNFLLVSGYCPYQDNCNININSIQTNFYAHDIIDINWDRNNFVNDYIVH